jgi:hypothetical protein
MFVPHRRHFHYLLREYIYVFTFISRGIKRSRFIYRPNMVVTYYQFSLYYVVRPVYAVSLRAVEIPTTYSHSYLHYTSFYMRPDLSAVTLFDMCWGIHATEWSGNSGNSSIGVRQCYLGSVTGRLYLQPRLASLWAGVACQKETVPTYWTQPVSLAMKVSDALAEPGTHVTGRRSQDGASETARTNFLPCYN